MIIRILTGVSYGALLLLVYCKTWSFAYLFNADTLLFEEMYRDLFQRGGTLAQWSLPMSSYWLDMGLYFLIRPFSPSVYAAFSLYAAVQVCLLAMAVWYFLSSLIDKETAAGRWLGVFAAFAAFAVSVGDGELLLVNRQAFHVAALALFFVFSGLLFRFLHGRAGTGELWAGFALAAAGVASDTIFVLWFCIPAGMYLLYLRHRGAITKKALWRWYGAALAAMTAGKIFDHCLKTNVTEYSAVKPSLRRLAESTPEAVWAVAEVFTASPYNMALTVFAAAGIILFLRRKNSRSLAAFWLFSFACIIGGTCINGRPNARYLMPVYFAPLLAGLSFLMALASFRFGRAAACGLVGAVSLATSWTQITQVAEEYYPPVVACVDHVAEKHGVTEAVGGYWEARLASALSRRGTHVAQSHMKYFYNWFDITTRNSFREKYAMVILNTGASGTPYEEDIVRFVNGSPDAVEVCSDVAHTVMVYTNGARAGTVKDYLLYDGALVSSKPERDTVIWEGRHSAGGVDVVAVRSRYRMERQWITVQFAAPPERLLGKDFTFYIGGTGSRYLQRIGEKRFDPSSHGLCNNLWRHLIKKESFTVTAEDVYLVPDGGCVVFFRAPDRETKKWTYFAIEQGGAVSRLI